jgi:hypothetical protein
MRPVVRWVVAAVLVSGAAVTLAVCRGGSSEEEVRPRSSRSRQDALRPAAPPTSAKEFRGRVLTDRGAPIAGARVGEYVVRPDVAPPGPDSRIADAPFETSTDAAGEFSLPVPGCRHRYFQVEAEGFAGWRGFLARSDRADVRLVPLYAARVEVRLTGDAAAGESWLATLHSLQGRRLQSWEFDPTPGVLDLHPRVPQGAYDLEVRSPALTTGRTRVDLVAGDVNVVLPVRARAGLRPLSGRVVDPLGRPLPGAQVSMNPDDTWAELQTESRADGSFEFPDLAADNAYVWGEHNALGLWGDAPDQVPGSDVVLRLWQKRLVTARVRTWDRATVTAAYLDVTRSGVPQGLPLFSESLPTGTFDVWAEDGPCRSPVVTIDVSPTSPAEIDVLLGPPPVPRRLEGLVLTAAGTPAASATVRRVARDGALDDEAFETDENGRFEVWIDPDVHAYVLVRHERECGAALARIDPARPLRIRLEEIAEVAGRASMPSSAGGETGRIRGWYGDFRDPWVYGVIDAQGAYAIWVPPGRYRFLAEAGDVVSPLTSEIEARPGAVHSDLDLSLVRPVRVAGTVRRRGRPLPSAWVSAFLGERRIERVRADRLGRFELAVAPPAELSLVVEHHLLAEPARERLTLEREDVGREPDVVVEVEGDD